MAPYFLCILFTIAAADYGAPESQPSYNPPVAGYNPPAVVPQPAYVQVQPPAPLPELPASHELLRHRRRNSDSSSEESRNCRRCKDLKTKCGSMENCHKPKISYIKCEGCRRAIISCKGTSSKILKTIDGEVLASGLGVQKVAKCGKHGWTANTTEGDKVDFKHVVCIGGDE